MKIDINGASITLTKEQLAEIKAQTEVFDWKSIKSISDAVNYLGTDDILVKELNHMLDNQNIFSTKTINTKRLQICIKAINECKILDWSYQSIYKYYNWYENKNNKWLAGGVSYRSWFSCLGLEFYYESKEKAKHGQKYFNELYINGLFC